MKQVFHFERVSIYFTTCYLVFADYKSVMVFVSWYLLLGICYLVFDIWYLIFEKLFIIQAVLFKLAI